MPQKEAERLFIDGGKSKEIRSKYNDFETREEFVAFANAEGYDFTVEELNAALKASGDSFECYGNPRKRSIWWF